MSYPEGVNQGVNWESKNGPMFSARWELFIYEDLFGGRQQPQCPYFGNCLGAAIDP